MLMIPDGRTSYYQWDVGQRLLCEDVAAGTEIHFSSGNDRSALAQVALTYEEEGAVYVDIPDVILQHYGDFYAYIYAQEEAAGQTVHTQCFYAKPRKRPADYVYGETVQTWEALEARIETLEAGGISDEAIGAAVDAYLAENPVTGGATAEEAAQIEANKTAIEELQDSIPTVPSALPNPYPLTINGTGYDGSEAVSLDISGGGGSMTAAEKIVDYTVDADGASAVSFLFSVEEYPKLAQYNHLRGIFRKSTNANMPWVQIALNTSTLHSENQVAGLGAQNYGMLGFEVIGNGGYWMGGLSAGKNPSLYSDWTGVRFPNMSSCRYLPLYLGALSSVSIISYTPFLDEGGHIEIWGWND